MVANEDKRLKPMCFNHKTMILAQEKIRDEETEKKENKVKILNPTPSNMDMGVLTEYVQTKRHLSGKSQ